MRARLPRVLALAGATAMLGAGIGLVLPAAASDPSTGTPPGSSAGFPHMNHVFVIMMENTGYATLLTPANTSTAFIRTLAASYGLETRYYGVTHPSLPNYVAATSGSTWGSNSDTEAQASAGSFDHTSLFDEMTQAGVTWKGYMESMPSAGYTGDYGACTTGANPTCTGGTSHHDALYVRKHDPFMQYPDISSDPALAANVVPLGQLRTDLARNDVPQFAWISPNVCNDMHGGTASCPYPTTTATAPKQAALYADGDAFLRTWVTAITSSPAWTGNSAIFITWDEGSFANVAPYGPKDLSGCCDSPLIPTPPATPATAGGGTLATSTLDGGGHVPMIVVARHGARGATDAQSANHYSLLQTVELNFGLPLLGNSGDTLQVRSLAPLLTPRR